MGYLCAPQLTGLVRGEPKPGQKHRSNGKAIAGEAGKERHSASETLDRTRSGDNVYSGFESGFECWDAMCEEADEYRIPTKLRNGETAERGLRKDAVIGFAVIFNPSHEMTVGWSEEDYQRFYKDSWEVLGEIEPDIFRDDNVRMSAEHCDEGRTADPGTFDKHLHRIGMCKDREGKFCGNKIDAKLLIRINENYPKLMRERGWELDDLDTTDWDRMKTDEEYRHERKQKQRERGRSVNKYLRDELNQRMQKVIELGEETLAIKTDYEAKSQEASTLLGQANQVKEDADEYSRRTRHKADADAKKTKDEALTQASIQRESAVRDRQQAERDASAIRQQAFLEAEATRSELEDREKEQDKREADFQVREDALEAQAKALDERKADQDDREKNLKVREKSVSSDEAKVKLAKSQAKRDRQTAQEAISEAQIKADEIIASAQKTAQKAENERQKLWEKAKTKIQQMLDDIRRLRDESVADPPQSLAQFAKQYKRTVKARGKYNILTRRYDDVIGNDGKPVYEIHNCYDDWVAEQESKKHRGEETARRFSNVLPDSWDELTRDGKTGPGGPE